MQITHWLSRLISPASTRGLSGSADDLSEADGPENFYHQRMRLSRTTGDVIANPNLLWTTRSPNRRRCGLRAHLLAERGAGLVGFTDLLLILNREDHARSFDRVQEPWEDEAARVLENSFRAFCQKERLQLPFADRPARFRFVVDGGPEMGGTSLGLVDGEYVTALLPNLYTAPVKRSRPVISVWLNLPGKWPDYREIGSLYSDQLLFTLGNHWLDNFSDPALNEPALYRLQQYQDGSFVHVINPELQDDYEVTCDEQPGRPAVLTLSSRSGRVIAYMVLAVLEGTTSDSRAPKKSSPAKDIALARPTQATPQRPTTLPGNKGSIPPDLATLEGHHTIVPEVVNNDRLLTLKERGALLQRVHFNRFMEGYDVYVGPGGQIGTSMAEVAATFQVRRNKVSLVVEGNGVLVDGENPPLGQNLPMSGSTHLRFGDQEIVYRDLTHVETKGWPYLGEIIRSSSSTHLLFGGTYRIGRDPRCRVHLPDEPVNDNIQWLASSEGPNVSSRSGDIPKENFYTDSIMVASEHAELDLKETPTLRSLARHCYTFVRQGKDITVLHPTQKGKGPRSSPLKSGDEVLVGNCLFEVQFSQDETPKPPGLLSPTDLAQAVDEVSGPTSRQAVREEEAVSIPDPVISSAPTDLPVAHGLGEGGPAPPPPALSIERYDSILGDQGSMNAGDSGSTQSDDGPPVVFVDETTWQVELGRPGRLVQLGWMVQGTVSITNHLGSPVIIPEARSVPDQVFVRRDYLALKIRARRGQASLLVPSDARLLVDKAEVEHTEDLEGATIEIVRRDIDGEEDFAVRLTVEPQPGLPDPRAQLLKIDLNEPLTAALFVRGLPMQVSRSLKLGNVLLSLTWADSQVTITDYLDTYQRSDGTFEPFFVSRQGMKFQTAPESGEAFVLQPGDQLLCGDEIHEVRKA